MSILIKGMKMPKDNTVLLRIYPKDKLNELYVEQLDIDGDTLNEYWAAPVPPHGRLIDADEFLHGAIGTNCFRGDYALMLEELVGESTTIIEAEEGER